MINFYRKIRRKFANDNEFLKYSRYAIGEIVLVMVGILLALQVNNWNEGKKDTVLETYYLNRLIEDLEADISEIEITIAFAQYCIVTGNEILQFLGDDYGKDLSKFEYKSIADFITNAHNHHIDTIIVNSENIGKSFGTLFDERTVDINDYTYNELIATGNFEVIENQELQKKLANYYMSFSEVLDIQNNLLFAVDEYKKAMNKCKIPVINSLNYQEIKNQLSTKEGEVLITTLKNLIWNHAYSLSPFENVFEPKSRDLISEIKEYME